MPGAPPPVATAPAPVPGPVPPAVATPIPPPVARDTGRSGRAGRTGSHAVPGTPALAKFGGTVVPVGSQSVEVLPASNGQVVAYVNDATGNLQVDGAAGLTVRLAGVSQPVSLAWQQPEERYFAEVTEVRLAPGPVEVNLTQNGQTVSGQLELVPVVDPPTRGGVVLAVGTHSAELLAKAGWLGAGVRVEPPGSGHQSLRPGRRARAGRGQRDARGAPVVRRGQRPASSADQRAASRWCRGRSSCR